MDQGSRIIAEKRVRAAGELEVMTDVAAGLLPGHGRHRVSERGALLQGREHGELHGAPQGRLADQQAGERGIGIEVVVGQLSGGPDNSPYAGTAIIPGTCMNSPIPQPVLVQPPRHNSCRFP